MIILFSIHINLICIIILYKILYHITGFDFISLSETWLEEKGWERIKGKLPRTHEWECSFARKCRKRGRAKGGFIIGKRLGWGKESSVLIKYEEESIGLSEIYREGESLGIISVYNVGRWKVIADSINRLVEDRERKGVIIGRDFNIRTGVGGGIGVDEEENKRFSKDKTIGNEGRNLIEWVGEEGWYIMNGNVKGDWEVDFTYVGSSGSSVIDYVLINDNIVDKVEEFKMDVRVNSDHMPLCIRIGREESREQEEEGEEEEAVEQTRMVLKWDEEAIQRYMENTEEMQEGEFQEEENVEDMWQKLKVWVKNAMIKKEIKIKKRKLGRKDWWDRSCTKKKREVKSWYRKWKKGRSSRERYVKARKEMKELYVRRQ